MSRVSQARSLGKYFLLVDNMLVVLGFFVVFPLISIRFVDQMGWAALMVGIALGLRQLVQQGLGIFGGAIADRFGAKPMIVTGMLMRAAGFATMGIAHEPWLLWFSCLLSGLGGTLFDPPRSALVVLAATIPSFNIPVAGILLLMGIDHFLDMGRSAINVLGNGIATAMLSKNEGLLTDEEAQPDWEVEKAEA